jgi:hypothetical protein
MIRQRDTYYGKGYRGRGGGTGPLTKRFQVPGYRTNKSGYPYFKSKIAPTPSSNEYLIKTRAEELKGIDVPLDISAVVATTSTNDDVILLNPVQRGDAQINRIGRKIRLKSLKLRIALFWAYSDAASTGIIDGNICRITTVWDTSPNGAATLPTFDDIFGQEQADGTATSEVLDAVQFSTTSRFRVLSDDYVAFQPKLFNGAGGSADTARDYYLYQKYINLRNAAVDYISTSDPITIANIQTGALYLVFRAQNNVSTKNTITVIDSSFARLRWYG